MKNKLFLMLIPLVTLPGCKEAAKSYGVYDSDNNKISNGYGAFLGRYENNTKGFNDYEYISLEADEYQQSTLKKLTNDGKKIFAYLNVGSLEEYRPYYNQFKDITFKDYENWDDERWIDVSNIDWQNCIINIAKSFSEMGFYGVYMDNVDVYSVLKEDGILKTDHINGLKNIITGVQNLNLKVMVNGGAEFFDDMMDQQNNVLDKVWGYHQEEVFTLIDDYDNDVFTKQDKEDSSYYKEIANKMQNLGKEIFFLEYKNSDWSKKNEIDEYCTSKGYHYYISKTVDLI